MNPDGSTKPPPEEKLLKLIRGQGQAPATVAVSPMVSRASRPQGRMPVPRVRGLQVPKPRWVTVVIGALCVVLVMEIGVLVVQLIRPVAPLHLPDPSPTVAGTEPMGSALPEVPSLAQSISHPLFSSSMSASPETTGRPVGAPSATAKLLASRLTLMGIMAGNPGQAIIEDAETKKTYFVTTGQAVSEGAVVEQILDSRVILDLNGEKIELTL